MKTYSIAGLFLFVTAVAIATAIATQKTEVSFTDNQPGDLQEGWEITLHERNRYLQKTRKIDGVFAGYQDGKKSFTVRVRMLDWFMLRSDCEYTLDAPELLFWPTVKVKDRH